MSGGLCMHDVGQYECIGEWLSMYICVDEHEGCLNGFNSKCACQR